MSGEVMLVVAQIAIRKEEEIAGTCIFKLVPLMVSATSSQQTCVWLMIVQEHLHPAFLHVHSCDNKACHTLLQGFFPQEAIHNHMLSD